MSSDEESSDEEPSDEEPHDDAGIEDGGRADAEDVIARDKARAAKNPLYLHFSSTGKGVEVQCKYCSKHLCSREVRKLCFPRSLAYHWTYFRLPNYQPTPWSDTCEKAIRGFEAASNRSDVWRNQRLADRQRLKRIRFTSISPKPAKELKLSAITARSICARERWETFKKFISTVFAKKKFFQTSELSANTLKRHLQRSHPKIRDEYEQERSKKKHKSVSEDASQSNINGTWSRDSLSIVICLVTKFEKFCIKESIV